MRTLLYGKNALSLSGLLAKFGLEEVRENPETIISYGGDGTFLLSEIDFPRVPKVMIRDSKVCKKCANLPTEEILERLAEGNYIENKITKLEAIHGESKHTVVNDIIITHALPAVAIRYKIHINNVPYMEGKEIIGDGIVAASPFGSGAYYRSITDGVFSVGIGLAFNNSTEQVDHIVVKESDEIRFELTRGQALLAVPGREPELVAEDESVIIRRSEECAIIWTFGEEFCYWAH